MIVSPYEDELLGQQVLEQMGGQGVDPRSFNPEQQTQPVPPPSTPWQNPAASTGANTSRHAPRIVDENGQSYLTEHGNRRLLQPNELTGAQGYVTDFWGRNPTGFQPGVGPQSNAEYDAQRFTSPGRGNIPTGAGAHTANQGVFAGFNFGRDHNRNTSAKDSFAHWGGQAAGGNQWHTKDGAAQWFRTHVMPGLQADGFEVLDVQGDTALIRTVENPEGTWIDFVQGADGENPMLAWQDQSYLGDAAPTGGGGAASPGLDINKLGAAISGDQ